MALHKCVVMSSMVTGSESAVKLMGVAKRYEDVVAVDYVDLDVKQGEIFDLLGPNGSGARAFYRIALKNAKDFLAEAEI